MFQIKEITQEYLNSLFEYKDGNLFWKISKGNRKAGDLCGNFNSNGYSQIKLNSSIVKTHRVIFAMHNGFMPKIVDHIDGNKANNKIENLREATSSQNNLNAKIRKDNKIGIKGISFCKHHKKFRVSMNVYGKIKSLGYFKDLELADLVSNEARNKYHKEFANNG